MEGVIFLTIDGVRRAWNPRTMRLPEIAGALHLLRNKPEAWSEHAIGTFIERLGDGALEREVRQAVRHVLGIDLPADRSLFGILEALGGAMRTVLNERRKPCCSKR